ncbi:MAG: glycosyltransferase family 4 protein [Desulfarculus sp.]|nr:glycosyltransferase family 4 protein [Desulfarculus sp.]
MRLGLARLKYEPGGGAETTLGLLARGLMERGHQVHVIASAWRGQAPAGLTVHAVAAPGHGAARLRAFAAAARSQAEALKLDTWLSLERVPGAPLFRAGDGCHAAWLKRRAAYEGRLKRWSFAFNPLHRAFLDLERRTLMAPELIQVIANSHLVARELEEFHGLGPERVTVIHNAVDEIRLAPAREVAVRQQRRRALGLGEEQPALLFLGSGFERKGLAFAIQALAHLPEAILLVAGRDRITAYERLARRLGVPGRVRFLGQQTDAPGLLAAADALVLPTIYDPCANACLEALYLGLPVVTTLANGASELVQEGVSGCLLGEPSDAPALALACRRALGLPRPVPHHLPTPRQWLDATSALLERAAAA